jgi:cob(I)alamin adenosyltransferase
MPDYFTGRGDDGSTSLLGEERVPKDSPRPTAYGAVDEASAALGLARAMTAAASVAEVTAGVQRDLYRLMAELAATPENAEKFRSIDAARVEWLEAQVSRFGDEIDMPSEFVIGGDSKTGAAFDVARTVVRRAERLVAGLIRSGDVENRELLRYLNRLSSLCFVLLLWENQAAGVRHTQRAKDEDE